MNTPFLPTDVTAQLKGVLENYEELLNAIGPALILIEVAGQDGTQVYQALKKAYDKAVKC